MKALAVYAGIAIIASLWGVTPAHAVTCTVQGKVEIQSVDSYYCDQDHASYCNGWTERDLDSKNSPMKYLLLSLHLNNPQRTFIKSTVTNANGQYSTTFDSAAIASSTCPNELIIVEWLVRVHESDVLAPVPRVRFGITDIAWPSPLFYSTEANATRQSGNIYKKNILHQRPKDPVTGAPISGAPSAFAQAANIFYTANSAISQMVLWHDRINAYFAVPWTDVNNIFQIRYNPNSQIPESGVWRRFAPWVDITAGNYNLGALIRHELGHVVHDALHGKYANGQWNRRWGPCTNYSYGNVPTHAGIGCEWGSAATSEGIASFFGIRSLVTTEDRFAWGCGCRDNGDQGLCTDSANDINTSPQRIATTCNGGVAGIGDAYVTSPSHCPRVTAAAGCQSCVTSQLDGQVICAPCPDIDADGLCDNYQALGFRQELNVVRYLWDIMDINAESGDDTTRSIANIAQFFVLVPCQYNLAGSDGSCNEPERISGACNPVSNVGDVPQAYGNGTRDSYNMRDLAVLLNTGSNGELGLNCGANALDE